MTFHNFSSFYPALLFRYGVQVNYYQKVKTEGKVVKDKEEEDSLTSSKQIATTMIVLHELHADYERVWGYSQKTKR